MHSPTNNISSSGIFSSLNKNLFPCSECGHFIALDKPKPLSIHSCSKCQNESFIPGRINDFWLYDFIDNGGMGTVYKAHHDQFKKQHFAIKILNRKHHSLETIENFYQEAQLCALFTPHQHTITAFEYGTTEEDVYIACKYIEGENLAYHLEENGPIDLKQAVRFTLQLLSAERFIYERHYLYRDLKPENIIIDGNKAYLVDFGLCRQRPYTHHDEQEFVHGSPYFIPPERILNHDEDQRSEFYSLGLLLCSMILGKSPLEGGDIDFIAAQHAEGLFQEQIPFLLRKQPLELTVLILDMIDVNPDKRIACFDQLESRLKAILES